MSVKDDQLIYEYLGRVADAAHGRLTSLERQELVAKVREEIEARRDPSGKADITRVLAAMGDPRRLVDRVVEGGGISYAGYRPPPGRAPTQPPRPTTGPAETIVLPAAVARPDEAPVDAPAEGTTGPITVRTGGPTVTAVGTARTGRMPFWPRTRRPPAPEQVWRDASGPSEFGTTVTTFQPRVAARTYGLEAAALLALTVGALWIPYLGWVVGLLLVTASRFWSVRDKGIAIALIPAASLGALVFYLWVTVGRDRDTGDSVEQRFETVSGHLIGVFKTWPVLASLLAASWLAGQLLARWRTPRI